MKSAYQIIQFDPLEDHPYFRELPARLYDGEKLKLQTSSDRINQRVASAGVSVLRNGVCTGRLILYGEAGQALNGKRCIFIGNYECEDDPESAYRLIDAACDISRRQGYHCVIGPQNGTTWGQYRFCTSPHDQSFFSEMVHREYYPVQWQSAGFTVLADYVSTIDYSLSHDSKSILEAEGRFREQGISFRKLQVENYEEELVRLFPLCENAFAQNFLYSPISLEDFLSIYKSVRPFIVPEMIFIAEKMHEPVGFAFNFPDYLNPKENRIILKTLARHPDAAYRGLGEVLGNLSQRYASQNGYSAIVHALIYSGNVSLDLSRKYHGKIFKRYSLYSKEL